MIFALSTDDNTLMVFASEVEATAYAEGVDVEDGGWLFFNDSGEPLETVFTVPNQRGHFHVVSGRYQLKQGQGPNLAELLPHVATVEGEAPLNTVAGIVELLSTRIRGKNVP